MKKLMIAASAAALVATSSLVAFAAEVTGSIAAVDPAALSVTLDDGKTYALPSGFNAASLQAGQKVKITYDDAAGGKMTATAIVPAS